MIRKNPGLTPRAYITWSMGIQTMEVCNLLLFYHIFMSYSLIEANKHDKQSECLKNKLPEVFSDPFWDSWSLQDKKMEKKGGTKS